MQPTLNQRIMQAIGDCDRYIEREERRAAELRPLEVAERLDWYRRHRAALADRLFNRDTETRQI
jgi:hypothetical protein